MTIPSTTRKAGPFTGNGSNTSFPFTFKVFSTEDVAVTVNDALGAETVLVLDSDYSVTLNVDQEATPGGTVTYPISGTPLASGLKLSITGAVAYEQGTDIPTGGDFNPTILENALDSLSMQIQQLDEAVSRAAVVPVTSPTDAAELSANIDLLATNITKLTTLYDNIDDIATVAADLNEPVSEINTVAGSIANVDAVGGSIANVNAVAGNATNINAVAGNATNINVVAGNATNINAVAGNATNINAVNANSTNINAVASDLLEPVSEIETVAGSIANVNTVGNNIANVNTVAGISSNVTTVAGISANVTTVAGVAADVSTVAGISGDVAAVENIASNVTTVANISSNVTTVAGISANVTTVAGISSAVTTVATNIADVQNAEENATAAINAKTAAESARDATLAALDSFDDRYLGQKTSDPTLDNDGNALAVGALYFNTTTGVMKVYDGTAWLAAYASLSGALLTTNNLSDLTNAGTARANLGLSSATQAEMEAGTEALLRAMSPLRVKQAIAANAPQAFPSGTRLLFQQTAAPTGWTKDTTHNDKALRVVSGTAGSGGSVAFTSAFASQAVAGTVGSTTLAESQIPSHTHTQRYYSGKTTGGPFSSVGSGYGATLNTSGLTTTATGGSGSHNHSFTGTAINLAVQYVDTIIATKD